MGATCTKILPGSGRPKENDTDGSIKVVKLSSKQKEIIRNGRQAFRHHMGEIGIAGLLG